MTDRLRREITRMRTLAVVVPSGEAFRLIDAKNDMYLHATPIPTLDMAIEIARDYNGTDSLDAAVLRSMQINLRHDFRKIWILGPMAWWGIRRHWGGFRKGRAAVAGTIGDYVTVGWFSWWRYDWMYREQAPTT